MFDPWNCKIFLKETRARERERKRKWIKSQGAKSYERGTPIHVHTYMHIPGSIINNKCVTLIIAKYSYKKQEREREREKEREKEKGGKERERGEREREREREGE